MTGPMCTPSTRSERSNYDVVVSIINYRTAEMTIACVASVLKEFDRMASRRSGHVVVVDNASGEGSAERIAAWIAEEGMDGSVTLVKSPKNSGFSGGHNQGIAAKSGRFYLVLNSDAVLRPGFFETILTAAHEAPDVGIVAPQLEDEDGTPQISCFRFPSPASELIRGAGSGPVTRVLKRWDMPLTLPPAPDQIGWVSFACVLLRAEMVEALGPMDEGYFLYFEDAEYCLRARRAGWGIRYTPAAHAVHYRGGSAPVKSLARARKRLPAYYYASRTRFLYQAYGQAGLWGANGSWFLGRSLANLRGLVGKSRPRPTDGESRDIWTNALRPLGPRRAPGE